MRRRTGTTPVVVLVSWIAALLSGGGVLVVTGLPDTSVALVCATPAPAVATASGGDAVPDLLDRMLPSIVAIDAAVEVDLGAGELDALGTGFVVRSTGIIVTAAHVIEGARSIIVTLPSGECIGASVLGQDAANDIAVLQVDRVGLAPVAFGRSSDVRAGQDVVVVGHALRLGSAPTVTVGIISATDRSIVGSDGRTREGLLQIDAAVNVGTSGGPVLDRDGSVIGVVTSRVMADGAEAVAFATSADDTRRSVERMLSSAESG